jgi:energy-coupling factor transporter ATP-binding protein EcfA2
MQNELKSAIRFDDFHAVFGAQGIVAMAWWLGARHAEQIRAEHHSFPFLYITGSTGSGKTSLLSYLWTLNGLDSLTSYSPGHATPRGLARIFANAGDLPVILETGNDFEHESKFDWDQIASLYNGGTLSVHSPSEQTQVTFRGTLVISANPPIECNDALESRMVRVMLTTPHTTESRHHAQALYQLTPGQAGAFGRAVDQRADQTVSTVNRLAPVYAATLYDKHPAQPSSRVAKNGGVLMALVDVLSLLLNLTEEQRRSALNQVEHNVGLAFVPY